jgi:hypothetical protein
VRMDLVGACSKTHAIDIIKLNALIGQFVTDLGAAVHTGMVVIGEKLGRALQSSGAAACVRRNLQTKTEERYLQG